MICAQCSKQVAEVNYDKGHICPDCEAAEAPPIVDPDWRVNAKAKREAALARYHAMPLPTEDTIEACVAALKAEGFKIGSIHGVTMTIDEMGTKLTWPLEQWQSVLHDWRFVSQKD